MAKIRRVSIENLDLLKKGFQLLEYNIINDMKNKTDKKDMVIAIDELNKKLFLLDKNDIESFVNLGSNGYRYEDGKWEIEKYLEREINHNDIKVKLIYENIKKAQEIRKISKEFYSFKDFVKKELESIRHTILKIIHKIGGWKMITLITFFGGVFVGMGIMAILTVSAMESREEEIREWKNENEVKKDKKVWFLGFK